MSLPASEGGHCSVAPAPTGGQVRLPLKVFVSYAHEDEPHRATLAKHLSALEEEGLIRLWHDRKITAGREWAGAIDEALVDAQIVLLLISADFLASDYCSDVELTEAIRLHDTGRARVVPVILRSCDWEHSRIARFNALPPDGAPVVEAEHPDRRFSAVAKGLRDVVAELAAPIGAVAAPAQRSAAPTGFPVPSAPLPRVRGKWLVFGVLVAAVVSGWAGHVRMIRLPLDEAARAMRIGHYERALQQVSRVPASLTFWPTLASAREKAQLGISLYQAPQDWQGIGLDLARQLKAHPDDADLLVMNAQYILRRDEDHDKARELVSRALKIDPQHAEAWFMQGLNHDLNGKLDDAIDAYGKAVKLAPDSPPYRNNLAHALLESGRYEEALREYRRINQFPLSRVEQALTLWALGRPDLAGEVQREALAMLRDPAIMGGFFNRRAWVFMLRDGGVRLPNLEEKHCYARLGEAASRQLAGEAAAAAFPPQECSAVHLRLLLADDLCRYVTTVQPSLAPAALRLRQALGQAQACPPPRATDVPPTS